MGHKRFLNLFLSALIASLVCKARAQDADYYPHGALSNIYFQEQTEERKAELMEQDAAKKRGDYERQKRDVDHQIAAHRFQIEQLKTRQEKAQDDLDVVNANLQHVKDQIGQYETEHKQANEESAHAIEELNEQRQTLEASQKKMEAELAALTLDRKRAEREIYTKSMEINRMKTESARLETKTAAAEAKRAELEAEEMKTRTEWMQVKMQTADLQKQHDTALATMNDAKERWTKAQKELADAKTDLNRVQKQRDQVVGQVQNDVARYEKEILAASKAKIAAEAEQIRLASEAEKMKDYASRIRETRDSATEQETEVDGMVLRTKVAVETARTELTKDVEASDRKNYVEEKENSKRRGIAAASEAASLLGGRRAWKTNSKCPAYMQPDASGQAVGFFEAGRKLLGKDRDGSWVEISNGSKNSVYVESKCGEFQN
jgi:hypothetical protein